MQLPDVNILVNALRRDGSHHDDCRAWLVATHRGPDPFAISPLSLAAVFRVVTNKRTFVHPSTTADAIRFANSILDAPHCVRISPGERHWKIYTKLLAETGITGSQTTDVWFAALALEWDCEWVTLDRGFAQFKNLRWRLL
jgi:toxin-antitoxin system PIN domain toxin